MSRRRWAILGAVVALVAGLVVLVVLTTGSSTPSPPAPVSKAAADLLAVQACEQVSAARDVIDTNGPAPQVQDLLAKAVDSANRAAAGNPRWVVLASNVQLMQLAIEHDDAAAAREAVIGVDVECNAVATEVTPAPSGHL